ncbi:DUF5703 domain-containing protein [Mucilaginibacter daejeonensis]|uniref:DUF5703 domain-containing protein n=1 Tax=Mucilaginibacter daejeonensis TaxID=398049 RepID=UPI001D17A963|nr:DUF5703 domain-containing protein [Mucilaginibacter daejeonensis]UEG52830.1 DUF5703 domain-containing protein [Mucilaginibacter daejeonensis]
MMRRYLSAIACLLLALTAKAQTAAQQLDRYDVTWNSQSQNSSESMPCGGGDIGLNVWVENGDLLFYLSKSGTFDENNAFLKLGRVRVKLMPNPFEGKGFKQQLSLRTGSVTIQGSHAGVNANIKVWVDVHAPVIHVDMNANKPVKMQATYESWRFEDRIPKGRENMQGSWKWANRTDIRTRKDVISVNNNAITFYHHNLDTTVFDATVAHEGMASVKAQMTDPLRNLTFGGQMQGKDLIAAGTYSGTYLSTPYQAWKLESRSATRQQSFQITLHTEQTPDVSLWQAGLQRTVRTATNARKAWDATQAWWKSYWDRSYVHIDTDAPTKESWQVGRNYQLFRYMLGCNAFGEYPTKFNGGLFTYDPEFTNNTFKFTPDFRNWGGGLMTAQNQRLVYFPMLKSGDEDLMKPQFDFYLRALKNAELRSKVYWGHAGASFTEQLENFGLPNMVEYGLKRPAGYDAGMEYNAWLEYEWDTVLEFCYMMLETQRYTGKDIKQYVPFIESCLTFFNEHYQYLARNRGSKALDGSGHLVLYPGSGGETYKMAYNSTSTVAALKTVLTRLLELPEDHLSADARKNWQTILDRIPPISFREFNGYRTISPALTWERVNNTESTQLYPVFPWGMYGVGKPDLDVALNTWKYDTLAVKFRSGVGWKQDNIFAARLGLTEEAAKLAIFKLKDSGRRFPAFWGPGFDWTPDHNWGGSGMIGLQEMLMQVDGKMIMLFPAWPKDWDVHFKLHAPYRTTIEAKLKGGQLVDLKVFPESRKADVVSMLK